MKSIVNTNIKQDEKRKMTLKSLYLSFPKRTSPRAEFAEMIAERCGVTVTTARNWLLYSMRPNNPEHIAILSEITGIAPEDMWAE